MNVTLMKSSPIVEHCNSTLVIKASKLERLQLFKGRVEDSKNNSIEEDWPCMSDEDMKYGVMTSL